MITLSAPSATAAARRMAPVLSLLAAAALLLSACGLNTVPIMTGAGGSPVGSVSSADSTATASTPYNLAPLLNPAHKYFGAALPNVPKSISALAPYTATVGKKPNVLEFYSSWGDGFDTSGVRRIYNEGALPYMAWEPYKPSLASIAKGDTDSYIQSVAKEVAAANLPIAISFGHEMNGDWYPWGRKGNTAADFVNAWHHIHDLFEQAGATNVIWVWSPNIINPAPTVKLAPYYPGDAYVDWVGMIGYYTLSGEKTFDTLFGPTMRQVQGFTKKPFLISETASQQGKRRLADVDDLFNGVQANSNVLGFIWFDIVKRADWRIEITPTALADFKKRASKPLFGFDIRNP
ncbi:mannan endo-1,4-beta-mannosidase [Streptacidiphilus sp. MAP12-16]|uniref:glycoside hydrolase family 26 protein n=1 Tax=Streptacidiphilus sp. MAP12-16 TaxID=3156300 RepID=UPI0035153C87